jgi:hypothetical protein
LDEAALKKSFKMKLFFEDERKAVSELQCFQIGSERFTHLRML